MAQAIKILVKNDNVVIMGKDFSCMMDRHLRAFETNDMRTVSAYFISDLIDAIPLDAYRIENKQYVVMKHYCIAKEL